MRHFLLTRWSLWGRFVAADTADLGIDPKWIAIRKELFLRFCLPSVRQQTVEDFQWLIMVGPRTSLDDRRWLESQDERIKTVEIDADDSPVQTLISGKDWVLTTRLDSDDAIRSDYFQLVRDRCGDERVFIECASGFTYDPRTGDLRAYGYAGNPFQSLFEPASDPETIMFYSHRETGSHGRVVRFKDRAWLQVIHGGNLSNSLQGIPVEDREEILSTFGIAS